MPRCSLSAFIQWKPRWFNFPADVSTSLWQTRPKLSGRHLLTTSSSSSSHELHSLHLIHCDSLYRSALTDNAEPFVAFTLRVVFSFHISVGLKWHFKLTAIQSFCISDLIGGGVVFSQVSGVPQLKESKEWVLYKEHLMDGVSPQFVQRTKGNDAHSWEQRWRSIPSPVCNSSQPRGESALYLSHLRVKRCHICYNHLNDRIKVCSYCRRRSRAAVHLFCSWTSPSLIWAGSCDQKSLSKDFPDTSVLEVFIEGRLFYCYQHVMFQKKKEEKKPKIWK